MAAKFRKQNIGSQEVEELKEMINQDKAKNKDKFQKINEALAILEKHLEQSNKKIGKLVKGEADARYNCLRKRSLKSFSVQKTTREGSIGEVD